MLQTHPLGRQAAQWVRLHQCATAPLRVAVDRVWVEVDWGDEGVPDSGRGGWRSGDLSRRRHGGRES
eukprot:4455938-Alexandrium_andersonii.AAC.1